MLIGVTGGIGAGKSFVAERLAACLEGEFLSADAICRELLEPGRPGYEGVLDAWGDRFLGGDRTIDRRLLRRRIFADERARERLEAILHPLVRAELAEAAAAAGRRRFVVAEVPLLFESGWQDDFDWIVCVWAEQEQIVDRVARRDRVEPADVAAIAAAQLDSGEKRRLADTVIENSGDRDDTVRHIEACAADLKRRFCGQ